MIDRRNLLFTSAAFAMLPGCVRRRPESASSLGDFAALQDSLGPAARLGVAALDTRSGRTLLHDADSRYAMCSTFKLPLAAAVLAQADRGLVALDEALPLTSADILNNSPASEAALSAGSISVAAACEAIITVSDNAAANLLLRRIGGAERLTAFTRSLGDGMTRFDRYELELNSNLPGDPRDTTTPFAMLGLMRAFLLGTALAAESQRRLIGWLEACATGRDRLRAGFPPDWRAGDKTGTAGSANNDVAIAWPPERAPILIASFVDVADVTPAARNAAHASVARAVAAAFGGTATAE